MRIKSLRRIKADCAVYDIEVDVDHSFIVGGCVLHNCVVCGSYDGKLFKSIKDAPQLPLHRGCRCLISPWFDIEGGTRESADGYVSDKVTFEDWLKAQDEKTQKEVLGKTRFELFKSGKPITQFVENGEVLSIKELNERLEAEKPKATEHAVHHITPGSAATLFESKSGGRVTKAYAGTPKEEAQNLAATRKVSDKLGWEFELQARNPQEKCPDAMRIVGKRRKRVPWEVKTVYTPTKNAIDMAVKGAKGQARNIILDVQTDMDTSVVIDTVKKRLRRSNNFDRVLIETMDGRIIDIKKADLK